MANEIFYISIQRENADDVYAFTRSATGVLDFAGMVTPAADELLQMQCVEGSAYFTPSWYTYLPKSLQATVCVYLPHDIENLDVGQYSFLLHVGALLLAVQERDGLLVADLLRRRSMVFANFVPLVLHIVRPIAAEALFANVYGGFRGDCDFKGVFKKNAPISTGETDVSAILLTAAHDALEPNPGKESPEEMFVRYFSKKCKYDFTIGIVGATNHPWVCGVEKFEAVVNTSQAYHLAENMSMAGVKKNEIYSSLTTRVQAEPYNPHDHNAICVSIDDLGSVLNGMRSKSKAGYLRAAAAEILRKAHPNLFAYGSSLWRLGADPSFFENSIVLRLKF